LTDKAAEFVMSDRGNQSFHYGYVIVLCMTLIMGVNVGLVMSTAGIFYQPVSTDLGVSVGKLGLYMSIMAPKSWTGRSVRRFAL
jgi:hypothetical protein